MFFETNKQTNNKIKYIKETLQHFQVVDPQTIAYTKGSENPVVEKSVEISSQTFPNERYIKLCCSTEDEHLID